MNIFPTSIRERWLLLLFPFKAYVFIAPILFFIWDKMTAGHQFRGAYEIAFTTLVFGFIGCLLAFICAGPILFWIGWRRYAFTCAIYAVVTFIILLMWLPMLAQA
jgi:hypothetical protein